MELIGHRRERDFLRQAMDQDRLSHSYLFTGIESIGKKKLALDFAKALLCKGEDRPCGVCGSCRKFDALNHPDFKLIEGRNGVIRKEEIDGLVGAVKTRPFESQRKVFIIDNSHEMNKESMNGLLKTLEEPPEFFTIILISHRPKAILPTIRSRCQVLAFRPLSNQDLEDYLLTKDFQPDQARLIASLSLGSLGLGTRILEDPDFMALRQDLIGLVADLLRGQKQAAYRAVDLLMDQKEDLAIFLDLLAYWFRDLLIYKELGPSQILMNQDRISDLKAQSFHIENNLIHDIIRNIDKTRDNIESNVNLELSLEMMFLNI